MTRDESTLMKGIAILLMLWLHLFNVPKNVALCANDFGQADFAHSLTTLCNPIYFFVILSGYGLYVSRQAGKALRPWHRIVKLFSKYWLTLALFLILAAYIAGTRVDLNFSLFCNLTTLRTTYNPEAWFIFPYVMTMLLSPIWFKLLDRFNGWAVVGSILLQICVLGVINIVDEWLYNNVWHQLLVYNWLLVLMFTAPFILGAACAKYNVVGLCKDYFKGRQWLLFVIIAMLIGLRLLSPVNFIHTEWSALMIPLLVAVSWPGWLTVTLLNLGKYSTMMWFTHSWICYRLFRTELYSLRDPLLIFMVLVLISLALAWVLEKIHSRLYGFFTRRREE